MHALVFFPKALPFTPSFCGKPKLKELNRKPKMYRFFLTKSPIKTDLRKCIGFLHVSPSVHLSVHLSFRPSVRPSVVPFELHSSKTALFEEVTLLMYREAGSLWFRTAFLWVEQANEHSRVQERSEQCEKRE